MHNNINIGVIACDLRLVYMAKMLADKGYNVYLIYSSLFESNKAYKDELCKIIYEFSNDNLCVLSDIEDIIDISDIIVGPVPMNKISEFIILPKFLSLLTEREEKKNFLFFAGMIDKESRTILENSEIKCIDYMESEKLATYNTIATAEGIIAEAIMHKNTNLHGSETLVLGYGKCGKTLANKLHNLSARVTVAARNENELENAYSLGFDIMPLSQLTNSIEKFEYIFNTIPTHILNEEVLNHIDKNSLILDIASAPGGVDKNAALMRGLSLHHSLGIPGKFAPKSSGEAIGRYLVDIISKHSLHKLNM